MAIHLNDRCMSDVRAFFRLQDEMLREAEIYERIGAPERAAEIMAARQRLKVEFFEKQEG